MLVRNFGPLDAFFALFIYHTWPVLGAIPSPVAWCQRMGLSKAIRRITRLHVAVVEGIGHTSVAMWLILFVAYGSLGTLRNGARVTCNLHCIA